jgi:hypothetical protein
MDLTLPSCDSDVSTTDGQTIVFRDVLPWRIGPGKTMFMEVRLPLPNEPVIEMRLNVFDQRAVGYVFLVGSCVLLRYSGANFVVDKLNLCTMHKSIQKRIVRDYFLLEMDPYVQVTKDVKDETKYFVCMANTVKPVVVTTIPNHYDVRDRCVGVLPHGDTNEHFVFRKMADNTYELWPEKCDVDCDHSRRPGVRIACKNGQLLVKLAT